MKRRRPAGRRIAWLEMFEPRRFLSGTAPVVPAPLALGTGTLVNPAAVMTPTYQVLESSSLTPYQTAGAQGFTPTEIRTAYGLNQVTFNGTAGTGSGQTIAIIDAYNDPTIQADLTGFDAAFSLAATALTVVSQTGSSTLPPVDPAGTGNSNWEGEEALDVEWAHAMAPGAKLLLVEATDDSPGNLFAAINYARQQAGVSVISMSWGGGETAGETQYDSYFTTPSGHTGVTFVASTGDSGEPSGYPAYSPYVVAAGGTSLAIDSLGNYQSETGWSGSGGGISQVETQPGYQNGVVTQTASKRANPDVAFVADPSTGASVYDSYNNGTGTPWEIVGGTSLAAPSWAGLIAVADQGRVLAGAGTLDSYSQTLPLLYSAPAADFHDITTGNNGYSAGTGYDLVTGRGSPKANLLLPFLVSGTISTTPPTPPPTSTAPTVSSLTANASTVTAGAALTLTANGVSDPGATGLAVTFYEESNGLAGLQTGASGDTAFTPVTDGSNTMSLDTTGTAGTFTFYVQVTDAAGGASATGTAAPSVTVNIVPPAGTIPTIGGITATPDPVVSGNTLTLTANNVVGPQAPVRRVTFYEESNGIPGLQTGPGGDLSFRSVRGSGSYSLQLDTTGASGPYTFYALAVDSFGNVSVQGTAAPSVTVDITDGAPPATPTGLTATAVLPTEIDLSYAEADTSQTGFNIERATDAAFINFTRVFTINRSTALNYSDTGLTPGTTYYYRVQAFNAAGNSNFSNTGIATTLSASNPTATPAPGLTQQYVAQLYQDLLGRTVDPTGLGAFSALLDQGQTTGQVAGAILNSQEYRQDIVQQFYTSILGRPADSIGLVDFTGLLAGGATDEQVAAALYGSPEFFQLHGSTNNGFLAAVYQDALGRAPDDSGLAVFMALLAGGGTRLQVANAILASTEYRQDNVESLFEKLLQHAPTPTELTAYVGQLAASTDETATIDVVTSHEYFVTRLGAVGTLNEAFVNAAFADFLGRPADANALQTFGAMLDAHPGLAGRQTLIMTLLSSAEYRVDLLRTYYQRFLNRGTSAEELGAWAALLAGGASDETVIAGILGSSEFYADQGSTVAGFLSTAFAELTEQPANPTAADFLAYQQALSAGTMTRVQVAQAIMAGSAYRDSAVNLIFQSLLLRDTDPIGLAAFTLQMAGGARDEQIAAEIAASAEYFGRI